MEARSKELQKLGVGVKVLGAYCDGDPKPNPGTLTQVEARSKELQKLGVGVKVLGADCDGDPKPNPGTLTQVEARSKELQKLGVGVKIVCVGKKGSSYFKRRLDRFTVSGAAPMCWWVGARHDAGWGTSRSIQHRPVPQKT